MYLRLFNLQFPCTLMTKMLLDTLISRPWKLFCVRKFAFLSVKVLSFDLLFSDQYHPVRNNTAVYN